LDKSAVRVLTPREMRRVERWARSTRIATMLSFFDGLPRFVHVPKPLLLGSNNEFEILLQGDTTTNRVRSALANLDEPFNPGLRLQRILGGKRREKPVQAVPSIYDQLQKGFQKICLLEDTGECGQKIVRAHSVQKSVFKGHAKNRHIYQFEVFTGSRDAENRLWPDLIGINEATTFTGFCERHDSRIFSAIDNSPFQNTPEQKFLHHYRAFAQAYYNRAYKFRVIESALPALAKKLSPVEFKSLAERARLNQQDVQDLEARKSAYDKQLRDKNWSAVEGYAFVGEPMPEILAVEFFAPRKDFQGHIIQNCKSIAPLVWLSMTITTVNDHAVFLLCAEKGCSALHAFARSLRRLPPAAQTTAIVTYVFCQFENFIMLPKWWESLPKANQLKFVNAFQGRYYPRELPNTCDWHLEETPSPI
ncbi:MAG: hypothetical protein NTW03_03295, partial [Verrucomicrobia bacterium]|nr:hypothetical protein [Verrucomicrobiota bacterium]